MNAESQFQAAMSDAGLTPPHTVIADGELHRWDGSGKDNGSKNSWYCLYGDGVPSGAFGDWGWQLSVLWCAKDARELTRSEREALQERIAATQRQRQAELARRHAYADSRAWDLWGKAKPTTLATRHPYLTRKQIEPHEVRIAGTFKDGYSLLIPVLSVDGRLHNLQTIAPDGEKRFLPGGRIAGCCFRIGKHLGKGPDSLTICEGFATGATIHQVTSAAVAVAFTAGNLLPVAQAMRAKYPGLPMIIAADDDWMTPGNPGLIAAKKAASAIGATLAVPDFVGLRRGVKDTDFNDMHRLIHEHGEIA